MVNLTSLIKKIAFDFGFDVRRLRSTKGIRSTLAESYLHIRSQGFIPKVVIDIGVAYGTFELYSAFPEAYYLLIEPLKEYEPALKDITSKFKGSYVLAAAGSWQGEVSINVHSHQYEGSSLLKETTGPKADGYERKVPIVRLDDILEEKTLPEPYLIKVDVQGAELEVLNGGAKALEKSEVIVLEVSLFMFQANAPEFFDVVYYMKQKGFVVYDVILGWNRPLDNALGQIDIVFVKEKGLFRQNHAYSTSTQIAKFFKFP